MGKKSEKRVLSLFSGCGGMDLGFEGGFRVKKHCVNRLIHPDWCTEAHEDSVLLPTTGFKTVFANDIRMDAQNAWENYFCSRRSDAQGVYTVRSIVDLVKEAKKGKKVFPEDIDIVTGGFPCQDFSVAGKRMGFNSYKSHTGACAELGAPSIESRGQLYMWMRDVVSIVRPKIFIAENVKGLVSLADAKKIIEDDFRSIGGNGYLVVDAKVLCAAEYGVPQSRERVIFIGFRRDALRLKAQMALAADRIPSEYDPYPVKTHAQTPTDDMMSYVALDEIFNDLPEPDESTDPSQMICSKAKYMGSHCQGQKEIQLDKIGPTIRSEHHGNIEFRRLSAEHGGTHARELSRGLMERRLTVRECARIQTFPDDYQFVFKHDDKSVNSSQAYQIVGNAVPPLLGFNIAMRIRENWNRYFG